MSPLNRPAALIPPRGRHQRPDQAGAAVAAGTTPLSRRVVLSVLGGLALPVWSQAYPNKPLRVIVPQPPGGGFDFVARQLAERLGKQIGQSVVVENKPGSGTLVGTDAAAKAVPDGYTLLVSHAAVHVYATATRRTMPFDALGDFTHMGLLVEAPMVLVVRAQSPFQSLAQYVEAARTKPVRYGTSGIGGTPHIAGELLRRAGDNLGQLAHQGLDAVSERTSRAIVLKNPVELSKRISRALEG